MHLHGDGHFTLIGYHVTVHGTWKVVRPGVMRWDGKPQSGARLPISWGYTVDRDTLSIISGFQVAPIRFHRIGSG